MPDLPDRPSDSTTPLRAIRARLTRKQAAAMLLFVTDDACNEGMMLDLWPLIRRPRLVTNALEEKGLIYLGPWWGDCGYELLLTPLGQDVVEALRTGAPDA